MKDSPNTPVFADRYRFEPVGNDWDRGRSGYTHLVYDLEKKRLGVIKRAETISKQAVEGLKNEVEALKALQGQGVPEVYETGEAIYGSKSYFYMVIEYIDGMRIERKLDSLNVSERAEILTQFFGLLAQAHRRGVVNGDVDLKHLFWRNKKLIVIDWGNTKLNVEPNKKTEFAYDLARSAEIIFSLVTRLGHPSATGPVALPDASALVLGLTPLPIEFYNLCKWAPRTPTDGAKAPYTTLELLEITKKWFAVIKDPKPVISSTPPMPIKRWKWLFWIPALIVILAIFSGAFIFGVFLLPTTATPVNTATSTKLPLTSTSTPELIETLPPTVQPTELSTQIPTVIPIPLTYSSPALTFDDQLLPIGFRSCWNNEITPPSVLKNPEGFYRSFIKGEEGWWIFSVDRAHEVNEPVRANFSSCLGGKPIQAVSLNAWVTRIEPEGESTPGREFGFFLETSDLKREYTFWIDKSEKMHLRIRENNVEIQDHQILIGGIQHGVGDTSTYDQFLIQAFLEIDNDGSDILYLLEGSSNFVYAESIIPTRMTRIDTAVLEAIGSVQKVGLVGRGGLTKVLIWPLVFYNK